MPTLPIQSRHKFRNAATLLVFLLVVRAGYHWLSVRNDPLVQGIRLSKLLDDARYPFPEVQLPAKDKIHSLGTNAIPLCIEYLSIDSSSTYWKLNNRLAKIDQRLAINSWFYVGMGATGFEALGPIAQPAVPALFNLLTNRPKNSFSIARALGATRDPRALSLFRSYLKNTDPDKRKLGMAGLEAMGKSADSEQAELIRLSQNDPDPLTRGSAVTALGHQSNRDIIVPHLIYLLQNDTNEYVRHTAALTLGYFPENAATIRPLLENLTNGTSRIISDGALIGLTRLEQLESLDSLKGPANAELIRIRSQQR